jgi:hypothetical protein
MISKDDSNSTQEETEGSILLTVAEMFRQQGERFSRQSTQIKLIIHVRKKQSIAVLCFVVHRHFLTIVV